jgi:hypothetical protein
MTVPMERTNAVVWTEQFLLDLLDPKKTPRVPKNIRDQARHLLRHYPTKFHMDQIAEREDSERDLFVVKVFGKSFI